MEDQANIEKIELNKMAPTAKGNYLSKEVIEGVNVYLDNDVPKEYENEWELSELTRSIQDARKKKNLNPKDRVKVKIGCSDKAFIEKYKDRIEEATSSIVEVVSLDEASKEKLIVREVSFSF
jgi:hypothetical protein